MHSRTKVGPPMEGDLNSFVDQGLITEKTLIGELKLFISDNLVKKNGKKILGDKTPPV